MRKASRTVLLAGGLALAVVAGVTGCGTAEKLSAKDSVSTAVDAVGSARTATFTLSLNSTVADLRTLEAAESGGSGDATAARNLEQVLAGEVTLSVSAPDGSSLGEMSRAEQGSRDLGTLLQDPAALEGYLTSQGSSGFAVRLDGAALVELRAVRSTVYARADVPKLLRLAGQDPAMLSSFTAQLPPALQPLAKAAKGEWIAVDLVEAARSLKSTGLLQQLPKRDMATSASPAAVAKLLQDLRTAYQQKARIAELGEDDDRGTGYRVSAPAKQVVQAIESDLVALAGAQADELHTSIAAMPDKDVSVDLWVKDEKLRAVSLDLTQFAGTKVDVKAALDIDIALDGDPVAAPDGANRLDVAEALVGLGGVMGGMAGGAGVGMQTP